LFYKKEMTAKKTSLVGYQKLLGNLHAGATGTGLAVVFRHKHVFFPPPSAGRIDVARTMPDGQIRLLLITHL
jgi:hypothetical protein